MNARNKYYLQFYLALLFLSVLSSNLFCQEKKISFKNGFYYIDGKKVFLKGIGYEQGAYPGMLPYNRPFNKDIMEHDMKRIVDGGFNTIRTWNAFTEQELQVVQNFNLNIIMGIWIDPGGDFSDQSIVNSALQLTQGILNYSKKYNNIIGYLIMNEPAPDHIFDVGYQNTVSLWKKLISLIHSQHPGVPVSIANTCVGDFIDPSLFDFSACNVYPYNPVTVNFTHLYPAYIRYLKNSIKNNEEPLIITEYGLSVSPTGPGNWGYGGNTLQQQEEGILYMFRSLLDGGASGSCIFNYSDGWWKAGNEFIHDDAAEEWFGLVEYTSVDDKYGTPRPAWDSVSKYNRAIITSPQNQEIYNDKIPVEIFTIDTVYKVIVYNSNNKVLEDTIRDNYLSDTIYLNTDSIEATDLKFYFENADQQILKTETISCLNVKNEIQLPLIEFNADPEPKKGNTYVDVIYNVINSGPLQLSNELDYAFYPHTGWDYGTAGTTILNGDANPSKYFTISQNINVITIAAGINATYGSFTKRIAGQEVFILADTGQTTNNEIIPLKNQSKDPFNIIPNPAHNYISLKNSSVLFDNYYITDQSGRLIKTGNAGMSGLIDISTFEAGFYTIYYQTGNRFSYSNFIKE